MFTNFIDFQKTFSTEIKCIRYLEKLRWNDKPVCFRCKQNDRSLFLKKAGLYSCGRCRSQFSIRKGTIFEDSPLPLVKWFQAFYYEISHIKAMSSYNLSDKIGVHQETAWFMQQRIRWALKNNTIEKLIFKFYKIVSMYFLDTSLYFIIDLISIQQYNNSDILLASLFRENSFNI